MAAVLGQEFDRQVLAACAGWRRRRGGRLLGRAVGARLVVATGAGRFAFAHDLVRETLYDALGRAGAAPPPRRRRPGRRPGPGAGRAAGPGRPGPPRLPGRRRARTGPARWSCWRRRPATPAPAWPPRRRPGTSGGPSRWSRIRPAGPGSPSSSARRSTSPAAARRPWRCSRRRPTWPAASTPPTCWPGWPSPSTGSRRWATPRHRPPRELLREAHRRLVGGEDGDPAHDQLVRRPDRRHRAAGPAGRRRQGADLQPVGPPRHHLGTGHGARARGPHRRDGRGRPPLGRPPSPRCSPPPCAGSPWSSRATPATSTRSRPWSPLGEPRRPLGPDDGGHRPQHHRHPPGRLRRRRGPAGRGGQPRRPRTTRTTRGCASTSGWALSMLRGRFAEADGQLGELERAGHPYAGLLRPSPRPSWATPRPALRQLAEVDAAGMPVPAVRRPRLWLRLLAQAAALTRDPRLCERARAALAPHRGEWAVSLYGCDIAGRSTSGSPWSTPPRSAGTTRSPASPRPRRRGPTVAPDGPGRWRGSGRRDAAAPGRGASSRRARLGSHVVDARPTPTTRRRCRAPRATSSGATARSGGWATAAGSSTCPTPRAWPTCTCCSAGPAPTSRRWSCWTRRPGRSWSPPGGWAATRSWTTGQGSYRRRLAELDEAIDQAAGRGDDRRAAALDQERAALLDQLRAAAGLAGRTRRLGDEAERARKTVDRPDPRHAAPARRRHPELAAHLRDAVSTGATCRYAPAEPVAWRL